MKNGLSGLFQYKIYTGSAKGGKIYDVQKTNVVYESYGGYL